jgi:predicted secreted Zn-dependent protease
MRKGLLRLAAEYRAALKRSDPRGNEVGAVRAQRLGNQLASLYPQTVGATVRGALIRETLARRLGESGREKEQHEYVLMLIRAFEKSREEGE